MTQPLIVGLLVLLCAAYWLQRLVPAATAPFWRGIAGALHNTRFLPGLRLKAERLSSPSGAQGCGGCKGCDKNGGCH